MGDVRGLDGAPAETPDPDTIELLEDLLAQAKRGQISSIAVATTTPGQTVNVSWQRSGSGTWLGALGAVTLLQSELLKHETE